VDDDTDDDSLTFALEGEDLALLPLALGVEAMVQEVMKREEREREGRTL
jgi:hypothetical protein